MSDAMQPIAKVVSLVGYGGGRYYAIEPLQNDPIPIGIKLYTAPQIHLKKRLTGEQITKIIYQSTNVDAPYIRAIAQAIEDAVLLLAATPSQAEQEP